MAISEMWSFPRLLTADAATNLDHTNSSDSKAKAHVHTLTAGWVLPLHALRGQLNVEDSYS